MFCDKDIIWELHASKITGADILIVERYFGVGIPEDLRTCIFDNNGASPFPNTYRFRDFEGELRRLLSFKAGDDTYVLDTYHSIKDYLPKLAFPFAEDSFGNMLCLLYSSDVDIKPTIVFWDHESLEDESEQSIIKLCNSFSELLASLR